MSLMMPSPLVVRGNEPLRGARPATTVPSPVRFQAVRVAGAQGRGEIKATRENLALLANMSCSVCEKVALMAMDAGIMPVDTAYAKDEFPWLTDTTDQLNQSIHVVNRATKQVHTGAEALIVLGKYADADTPQGQSFAKAGAILSHLPKPVAGMVANTMTHTKKYWGPMVFKDLKDCHGACDAKQSTTQGVDHSPFRRATEFFHHKPHRAKHS